MKLVVPGEIYRFEQKKKNVVSHEVAQKVSMSGAKARIFFQRPPSKIPKFPTSSTFTKKWELWKDLL